MDPGRLDVARVPRVEAWFIGAVLALFLIGRGADMFTRVGPAKDDPEKRRRLNWIWFGAMVACVAFILIVSWVR